MNVFAMNLTIEPNVCLVDDEFRVTISGLPASSDVTVVCRVHEDNVRLFSYAHYVSDRNGRVDVTEMESKGGRYDGVEPMGLINSQIQEPGQKPGRRLGKSDVTTPLVARMYALLGHLEGEKCLDLINGGSWLCQAECERWYMGNGVKRIEVQQGRLLGTLFIPSGDGLFPGVIDLFGTVGGTTEHRSALFASRGIASFTLCYFTPGKGEGLVSDIEYFKDAVDYLLGHPQVLKPHVGIIGVSKGSELALMTAAFCHKIRACVTLNGVDFPTLVNHTHEGKDLPWIYLDIDDCDVSEKDGYSFANLYDLPLEEREPFQIPVELGVCDYLILHSGDDRAMPPSASEHVAKRLKRYGRTNYQRIVYPGAGHLLEPPHSPHFFATYHALFKNLGCWGGTRRQHARAQEDAWQEILNFFKSKLSPLESKTQTNKSML